MKEEKEREGGRAHDWLDDPRNLVDEGDGSGDMVENGDLSNLLLIEEIPKKEEANDQDELKDLG